MCLRHVHAKLSISTGLPVLAHYRGAGDGFDLCQLRIYLHNITQWTGHLKPVSDLILVLHLNSPLFHSALFYDFHLQLVIKSMSSISACNTCLMHVSHKVTFTAVWRVRHQLFSLSMRFQ